MGRLDDGVEILEALARIAYEEEIRYPAAALAYYAFVSFVPFLLLAFAAAGDRLVAELSRAAPLFLTPSVQTLVTQSLTVAADRTSAGLLSVLVLLWSSANVVGDVRTVIKRIEGPDAVGRTLRDRVRDGAAVLGGLGLAIVAIVLTSLLFEFPPAGRFFGLPGALVLWLALTVAFVPTYYVPSGLVTSPAEALPGAVAASFGWTVLHTVVQFYAVNAGRYAVYGVLSGVIVVLTTLYAASAVLLTGIIINAWLADGAAFRGRVVRREE
jgi:membrane protein